MRKRKLLKVIDGLPPRKPDGVPDRDWQAFASACQKVQANFNRDFDTAKGQWKKLLKESPQLSGINKIKKIFKHWDKNPASAPSVTALAAAYFADKDIDEDKLRQVMTAALLADIPNDNPYHGNHHFRKVTMMNIVLSDDHVRNYNGTMSAKERANHTAFQAMLGAIHDIYHDGGSNTVAGMHMPARLEKMSIHKAAPFLRDAGIEEDRLEDLHACVVATDCSGAPSPQSLVHDMYGRRDDTAYLAAMDFSALPEEVAVHMERLRDKPELLHQAMTMCEADVIPSAALSLKMAWAESNLLHAENPAVFGKASAEGLSGFFNFVVRDFQTPAAKKLAAPRHAKIKDKVDDIKNGQRQPPRP